MNEELKELQDTFAGIDLNEHLIGHKGLLLEVLIKKMLSLKIKMYKEPSYKTPHIHIDYNKQNHVASYSINTGEIIDGDMKSSYDRAISAWIDKNREQLLIVWNSLQQGQEIEYSIP